MKNATIPPTHFGWAQFKYRGKFVRWFPRGQAREYTDASGKRIFCTWEQGGPHPHSGFTWWYPAGENPPDPPPEEPERPGTNSPNDEEEPE